MGPEGARAPGCVKAPDLTALIGPRHDSGISQGRGQEGPGHGAARVPSRLRTETALWRELAALTGRHGARTSIWGAERKARSRRAEANGRATLTPKSYLVQP